MLKVPGLRLIRVGMAASPRCDPKTLVKADMAFHGLLYKASGNPLLTQTATIPLTSHCSTVSRRCHGRTVCITASVSPRIPLVP